MADEIVAAESKKKVQRRLYKNVYVIVNRQDPKDNELCFDQNELMTKLMDPEWTSKYFPIVIDTDKLYHV
jgi:hypothetical protein